MKEAALSQSLPLYGINFKFSKNIPYPKSTALTFEQPISAKCEKKNQYLA